jgi:hypothetical protein
LADFDFDWLPANAKSIPVDPRKAADILHQIMNTARTPRAEALSTASSTASFAPTAPTSPLPTELPDNFGQFLEDAAAAEIGPVGTALPVGDAPHGEAGQQFGAPRDGGRAHGGLDFGVPTGTAVGAYSSGTVIQAGEAGDAGIMVTIDHGNGIVTKYMHLSQLNVAVGDQVKPGQLIASSGATGAGTGPHLHFQVEEGGQAVDPGPYLAGGVAIVGKASGPTSDTSTTTVVEHFSPEEVMGAQASNVFSAIRGEQGTQDVSGPKSVSQQTSTTVTPGTPGAPPPPGTYGDDPEGWVRQAMAITGVGEDWFEPLMARMRQESGGRPDAVNDWDSNAAAGTPSIGLFQTIQPTFDAYKVEGMDDIWNPVHNAVAAINYMKARYGSVHNLPSGGY